MPSDPIPIDPSYQPQSSIVKVQANTPIEHILAIIERDGGVILENLISHGELASIEEELKPWCDKKRRHTDLKETIGSDAFHTIPRQTIVVPGLVGKSDTIAAICEHPVLEQLREKILRDEFSVHREDWEELNTIDPLLSVSLSLNIVYGSPRQRLHRDDNTHGIRHPKPEEWGFQHASQFGCLIAGCEVTRENGATMFVPGSHKWGDDRLAATDEVCFAGIINGILYDARNSLLMPYRNVGRFRSRFLRVCFPCGGT
jgi:ectoine hydroxylase-related dioxygenase (phytanoyl-CoA dioxygenase family)